MNRGLENISNYEFKEKGGRRFWQDKFINEQEEIYLY